MARTNRTAAARKSSSTSEPNSGDADNGTVVSGADEQNAGLSNTDGSSVTPVAPDSAEPNTEQPAPRRTRSGSSSRTGSSGSADRAARKRQDAQKATENLTVVLHNCYAMLSAMSGVAELELAPTESAKLADAITRVNAEFDVTVLSPKAAALINLGVVAGGIFIPRVIGIKARRSAAKEKQRAERAMAN